MLLRNTIQILNENVESVSDKFKFKFIKKDKHKKINTKIIIQFIIHAINISKVGKINIQHFTHSKHYHRMSYTYESYIRAPYYILHSYCVLDF